MTYTDSQPIAVLHDGPVFADEFAGSRQRLQEFRTNHDLDQRRLVPAKSAASGVHTVYFRPEHREWALVRLADRYRWAVEIQLLRGMSGERQLLRMGFTAEDVGFLGDILPEPPATHSPVVYDVLWLAAMSEAYVRLARAVREAGEFQPRDVLRTTEGLDLDDVNYLTRFLRSHLIRESVPRSSYTRHGSNPESAHLTVDLDTQYEVTPDGRASLDGIVEEYDRIFERAAFDPLLVDPERDPESHLRAVPSDNPASEKGAEASAAGGPERAELSGDGGAVRAPEPEATAEESLIDGYTDDEVAEAARAACACILEENVVRAEAVKQAAWNAVDHGDRSKAALWRTVTGVLLESDVVDGRPNGRIWTARTFTPSDN